ncbi:unnamed protein product [Toxocara canis]|uniref:LIM zinc-binding domain-containing protein n=1 Tax=Toxocara canis TaxID=6265 RepID=A0A183UDP2_TOXCA|nr:unnamed protein product [Toxocara canis]
MTAVFAAAVCRDECVRSLEKADSDSCGYVHRNVCTRCAPRITLDNTANNEHGTDLLHTFRMGAYREKVQPEHDTTKTIANKRDGGKTSDVFGGHATI